MSSEHVLNKSLFEICQAMVSALELEDVLNTILDLTLKTLDAHAGSVLLFEKGSEHLRMLASKGLPSRQTQRGYIPRKGSIAEWVIENNRPIIVNKITDIFPDKEEPSERPADAPRSAMCAPLRAKGEIIGTLNLNRYGDEAVPRFEDGDLEALVILASQAAVSIENARLFEQNMQQARMAAIGQTVAGISHCVKNMLTGLRGGLGILELSQMEQDWDSVSRATTFLKNNIERISLLVMDMLDYSREKKPARRRVSLHKIVQDVMDVVAYKAEARHVELKQELQIPDNDIQVDSDQIFRCLLNLVENAIDAFEDREGFVRVRVKALDQAQVKRFYWDISQPPSELGQVYCIEVEDNGSGIPPEHLENIFQPFFSTKDSKGTGLGLAVTRKIVEEHGGRLQVKSTLNEGTSFYMVLPENPPRPAQVDSTEQDDSPAESLSA